MNRVHILGVPIDDISVLQARDRLLQMLPGSSFRHIVTPNNEMLVYASTHPTFHAVLTGADLALPDSTGLLYAACLSGQKLQSRCPGVDAVEQLLLSVGADSPVFFLGGRNGVGQKTLEKYQAKNSNLTGTAFEGTPTDADAEEILSKIYKSGAKVLLVAYGAPQQDLWIAKHKDKLGDVRIAIGVGGTFDFLSGAVCRAPKLLRCVGLEWLWRLLLQPSRIVRIWKAVVVFPLLVLRYGKSQPRR